MNKTEFIAILKNDLKREENDKKVREKLLSDLKSYEGKTVTARIKSKSTLITRYEATSSYIRVFVKGLSGFAYINLARKDNKIYNEKWIREENPAYFRGVDQRIAKLKKILSNKNIVDKEYDKYKRVDSAIRELMKVRPTLDSINNPAHYQILKKIGTDIFGKDKEDKIINMLRL